MSHRPGAPRQEHLASHSELQSATPWKNLGAADNAKAFTLGERGEGRKEGNQRKKE